MPPSVGLYPTRSIRLAAFLKLHGFEPVILPIGERSVLFQFTPSPDLLSLVERFERGDAAVSPIAFDQARVDLRRALDVALNAWRRGAP